MKKENVNNYGGYIYKYSVASYEDNVCRYDMFIYRIFSTEY